MSECDKDYDIKIFHSSIIYSSNPSIHRANAHLKFAVVGDVAAEEEQK